VAIPNPQSGPFYRFDVYLTGPTGGINGSLYTKSMTLLGRVDFEGNWVEGWNLLTWVWTDLPNGVYYVRFVTANGKHGKIARLFVLH
jgi:hypothetical protein